MVNPINMTVETNIDNADVKVFPWLINLISQVMGFRGSFPFFPALKF